MEGPSDLRTRCEEILAWRKTGVLPGEALRTLAREKYGDEYDAIQRAERDTETEALNFVVAAPTTQPAPQQEAQEPVAWQSRTRPTWEGNTSPWSPWKPCTKEQAEDCWKTRLLNGWAYQARALYTAPQPTPAPLSDDLRDRLVAISEAIADQDDRAAQAMLREILEAPQPATRAES